MRAIGVRPSAATASAEARTRAAAPSVMPGALPAVHRPAVRLERGLEAGQRLERGVGTRILVGVDDGRSLLAGDLDRNDLVGEAAVRDGRQRALVRTDRELVLGRAAHLVLDRHPLRVDAHVHVADGAPQPVMDRGSRPARHSRADTRRAPRAGDTDPGSCSPCRRPRSARRRRPGWRPRQASPPSGQSRRPC